MAQMQFKLRMPEPLREAVEQSAKRSGNSLNTEIVQRLEQSFRQDRQFGDQQLSRLAFGVAANFAVAVQEDDDWTADPVAYTRGATAAIRELIRGVPGSTGDPGRKLAVQAIISQLLTILAQESEK
jgi:Arc-like DNA binding domain